MRILVILVLSSLCVGLYAANRSGSRDRDGGRSPDRRPSRPRLPLYLGPSCADQYRLPSGVFCNGRYAGTRELYDDNAIRQCRVPRSLDDIDPDTLCDNNDEMYIYSPQGEKLQVSSCVYPENHQPRIQGGPKMLNIADSCLVLDSRGDIANDTSSGCDTNSFCTGGPNVIVDDNDVVLGMGYKCCQDSNSRILTHADLREFYEAFRRDHFNSGNAGDDDGRPSRPNSRPSRDDDDDRRPSRPNSRPSRDDDDDEDRRPCIPDSMASTDDENDDRRPCIPNSRPLRDDDDDESRPSRPDSRPSRDDDDDEDRRPSRPDRPSRDNDDDEDRRPSRPDRPSRDDDDRRPSRPDRRPSRDEDEDEDRRPPRNDKNDE